MYLDLISSNATIAMNIKLAKITDITTAVYFAELANILIEVKRKNTWNNEGYFKLDRDYVEDRTTIAKEDQYLCDTILSKLQVLETEQDNPDSIRINPAAMANIIAGDELDPALAKAIKKKVKASPKEAQKKKHDAIAWSMKEHCKNTVPAESLHQLLYDWVDSVTANKRALTFAVIDIFVEALNKLPTESDKIDFLKKAISTGYTDPTWITCKPNYQKRTMNIDAKQTVSTELNLSERF